MGLGRVKQIIQRRKKVIDEKDRSDQEYGFLGNKYNQLNQPKIQIINPSEISLLKLVGESTIGMH